VQKCGNRFINRSSSIQKEGKWGRFLTVHSSGRHHLRNVAPPDRHAMITFRQKLGLGFALGKKKLLRSRHGHMHDHGQGHKQRHRQSFLPAPSLAENQQYCKFLCFK
jgi:hypothetical protein